MDSRRECGAIRMGKLIFSFIVKHHKVIGLIAGVGLLYLLFSFYSVQRYNAGKEDCEAAYASNLKKAQDQSQSQVKKDIQEFAKIKERVAKHENDRTVIDFAINSLPDPDNSK